MSHELRTPLNAIIGFSDMLKGKSAESPEQVREYAEYISDASRHLLELINQVLDISKIHAGRMELSISQVQPEQLVAHCMQLVRPRADERNLTLVAEMPKDMPAMEADATRLKQVVLNLLSNAVKFSPEGGRVRVALRHRTEDDMVELVVEDNGEGMTPQEVARACEPFEQIHDQLNKKHEGTGLGLPISISLVEMHGGRLEISSRKGEGTRVRVLLPRTRTERPEAT
jgi:two-component system cell cycle sensor histidine kinase PleC